MNLWKNRNFTPMLLKEVQKPFDNKDYLYEIKFDGYRALVFASKTKVQIMSRNNNDITYLYPELQEISSLVNKNVIFDGEIIIEDNGVPSFMKLQKRSLLKKEAQIKRESLNNPVLFMAFDILYEDRDITNMPLVKRKRILDKYLDNEVFIKAKYIKSNGTLLYKETKKKRLEGIVAKKMNGLYHVNSRTDDFVKIKHKIQEKFYILEYQENKNNTLSLLLGEVLDNKYYYVGKVLVSKDLEISKKIIKNKEELGKYLVIINYLERTKMGHLRHPEYLGYEELK